MNINTGGSFRIEGHSGKVVRHPESTAPQTKAGPPEKPEEVALQPDAVSAPPPDLAAATGDPARHAGKTK